MDKDATRDYVVRDSHEFLTKMLAYKENNLVQDVELHPASFSIYTPTMMKAYHEFKHHGVFIDESGSQAVVSDGFIPDAPPQKLKSFIVTVRGYRGQGRIVVMESVSTSFTARRIMAKLHLFFDQADFKSPPAFIVLDGGGNLWSAICQVFCQRTETEYMITMVRKGLGLPYSPCIEISRCLMHLDKLAGSHIKYSEVS